jgi:hypothetical protein
VASTGIGRCATTTHITSNKWTRRQANEGEKKASVEEGNEKKKVRMREQTPNHCVPRESCPLENFCVCRQTTRLSLFDHLFVFLLFTPMKKINQSKKHHPRLYT